MANTRKLFHHMTNPALPTLPAVRPVIILTTHYGPVGPRIRRGTSLPRYQDTYEIDELPQAQADAVELTQYIAKTHGK